MLAVAAAVLSSSTVCQQGVLVSVVQAQVAMLPQLQQVLLTQALAAVVGLITVVQQA